MPAAYKRTIATLVIAAQLLPVSLVFVGTFVAISPTVAMAQSTESECTAAGGTWTPGGMNEFGIEQPGSCQQAGASVTASATQRQQNTPPVGDDCSLVPGWFSFSNCMNALLSALGALFLSIGASLLQFTGWIFDWMVKYIVVSFGQTVRDMQILDAITAGWTVFRDFANILIIGFFVFIAISIILGVSEFGQKRLIANVLVVAVLMNFSLLFTKLVIDGSNFVAYQVYTQIASSNGQTTGQFNISERILAPMGISEVWNTYGLVRDVSIKQNSGGAAFAFGLVGGMLLLAIAAVLLYGCFLIAARGIMFIFLMLTAPIAFATYLIPTLSHAEYGWSSWWRMLINNAAFGPLLMILLAISLSILNAAGGKASVPIGDIIAKPGSGGADAWMTILVYIIGIGLIFTSLKLASSFAGAAGAGASGAFGALKFASWSPFAGSAALIGAGLRNRLGGKAAFRSLELDEEIRRQKDKVRLASKPADLYKENQKLMQLLKQKGSADKTATREFNFENTALGKALMKAGMPKVAGDTKGGFADARKKAAEEAAKSASSVPVNSKEAEKLLRETMKEQQRDQRETATQIRDAAQEMAESAKRGEQLHEKQQKAEEHLRNVETDAKQKKVEIDKQYSAPHQEQQRRNLINEQEERIKTAKREIDRVKERMGLIDDAHMSQPHVQEATNKLKQLDREIEDVVQKRTQEVVDNSLKAADHMIQDAAHGDAYTAAYGAKRVRELFKNKRARERFKLQKEVENEVKGSEPPSETPKA